MMSDKSPASLYHAHHIECARHDPDRATIFWGPMAYAIMGGLLVATLLTLLFLPALYVAWFRVKEPALASTTGMHDPPKRSDFSLLIVLSFKLIGVL